MQNENSGGPLVDRTASQSTSMAPVAVTIRKSIWQASQNYENFLRKEGCGELTSNPRATIPHKFALACVDK